MKRIRVTDLTPYQRMMALNVRRVDKKELSWVWVLFWCAVIGMAEAIIIVEGWVR